MMPHIRSSENGKPASSKSSKTAKTTKSVKLDKSNPAYIYQREVMRSQELIKKRNQTARLHKNRFLLQAGTTKNNFNKTSTSSLYNSTFKWKKPAKKMNKVDEIHQRMMFQLKDPKNPYSTYWSSKLLDKRFG